MTAFPERQTTMAAGWSRRTAAFSAVLLITVWTGHHFGLVETPAYLWVLALVALLAAFALLFAGWAFARLWNFGDQGGRDLTAGALIALLVLAPYAVASWWALTFPPLSDISTDLETAPALADGRIFAATPGEWRLQTQAYPLVKGRRYDLPFSEAVVMVQKVLRRQGWKNSTMPVLENGDARELLITAAASSFALELPVDVAIRVAGNEEISVIDMRSASRYGRHDLGDNADRIVRFLKELDQEVTGQTGIEQGE